METDLRTWSWDGEGWCRVGFCERTMGRLSSPVSVGFALAFAISIFPSSPFLSKLSSHISLHASPPSPPPLASDLLSLLGTKRDAAAVEPREACRLSSCLRFLVPFSPAAGCYSSSAFPWKGPRRGRNLLGCCGGEEEDKLVWWPPEPVMDLARVAVYSGGDPAAVHTAMDPAMLPIPDVEGLKKDKCQLTRTPYGRRFINEDLNAYLAFLFELIAARGPMVGLNVSLNRYDLFHGHIFVATRTGRLGILFHAREYPALDKKIFPYNMGYCQKGSCLVYDDSINLRNILWLAPLPSSQTKAWLAPGVLVVLDAHPSGIIYEGLVPEYVDYVRTIYEDDFGDLVADVNYLNIGNVASGHKIFIC